MLNQNIKVVLIGCGRIAYKHVEAILHLNKQMELVAVCDVILDRANEKADLALKTSTCHDRPTVYSDYMKLIREIEFEVGVVATESGNHYEHSMTLLQAGKHVIVEKPIALSTRHANEMVQLAREKNLMLTVCHQNRYNAPVQALKEAISKGQFGKIVNGTARILWSRDQNYYHQAPWRGTAAMDGGTLMNQCIHNIDLLLWMMDSPVESVYAQTGTFLRQIEMEDFGAILIRFKNGSIGIVEGSACVFPKNLEETLSIFGEKGTVVIGGLAVNEIQTWALEDEKSNSGHLIDLNDEIDNVYGNGHVKLYDNVYHSLRGNQSLLIDGESGSLAMNVILASYKSQKEGCAVQIEGFEYSTIQFKEA